MLHDVASQSLESPSTHSLQGKVFYAFATMVLSLLLIAGTVAKDTGLVGGVYSQYWAVLGNLIVGAICLSNFQLFRDNASISERRRKGVLLFFALSATAAFAFAAYDFSRTILSIL